MLVCTIKAIVLFSLSIPQLTGQEAEAPFHRLSEKDLKKYNSKKAFCYQLNASDLDLLRDRYHDLKLPKFMDSYMKVDKSDSVIQFQKQYPHTVSISPDRTIMFQLNPGHLTKEHREKMDNVTQLKSIEEGVALIAYYFHPNLNENYSQYFNDTPLPDKPTLHQDVSKMSFREIEQGHSEQYLVSILDLTENHVPYLKNLKTFVDAEMKSDFNITEKDQIRYYFHFPYDPSTAGLHLHVKVNSASHLLENAKSFQLQEIIDYLDSNRTVAELIISRASSHEGCSLTDSRFVSTEVCVNENDDHCYSSRLVEQLGGLDPALLIKTQVVPNPYYVEL